MLIDSHCHLDSDTFHADRAEVLQRARIAGVTHIVIPGTDLASSRKAVALANEDSMLYAAVGIHPSEASNATASDWDALEALAQHPRVVAIGEIGLDYSYGDTSIQTQREVLWKQLDLAARIGLPVILHMREARQSQEPRCARDLLALIREWTQSVRQRAASGTEAHLQHLARQPGVFHAFSGPLEMAQEVIRLGFFLGVGGVVTFPNARLRQEITAALPLESLLLETDAPYLAPHPHRGQRNEPAYLRIIADKISLLHQRELAEVATITSENARRLFAWE